VRARHRVRLARLRHPVVKGSWKYGELEGIKRLAPEVELRVVGEGFVGIIDDTKDFEVHCQAARDGLLEAGKVLAAGSIRW